MGAGVGPDRMQSVTRMGQAEHDRALLQKGGRLRNRRWRRVAAAAKALQHTPHTHTDNSAPVSILSAYAGVPSPLAESVKWTDLEEIGSQLSCEAWQLGQQQLQQQQSTGPLLPHPLWPHPL